MRMRSLAASACGLVLLPLIAGCLAPVGAGSRMIPSDAASQCRSQCKEIGMGLGAVAIMSGHVGCVCQGENVARSGAATTAGMATIMLQEQASRDSRNPNQSSSGSGASY